MRSAVSMNQICAQLWRRSRIVWRLLCSILYIRAHTYMTIDHDQLRLLPSVDELLQSPVGQQLLAQYSHALVARAIRTSLAQARAAIRQGASCPSRAELLAAAQALLQQEQQSHLRSLINATGVIIN